MKYLGLAIMFMLVFASCMFSNSKKEKGQLVNVDIINTPQKKYRLGDSITVDTVIGNFRIHYKVTDIVDTTLAPLSCDEESSVNEIYKIDKQVLLTIQKLDTTSVVDNRIIDISNFNSVISNTQEANYYIDMFYLKEIQVKSLTFRAILCKFGTTISEEVDIHVSDSGLMDYSLAE